MQSNLRNIRNFIIFIYYLFIIIRESIGSCRAMYLKYRFLLKYRLIRGTIHGTIKISKFCFDCFVSGSNVNIRTTNSRVINFDRIRFSKFSNKLPFRRCYERMERVLEKFTYTRIYIYIDKERKTVCYLLFVTQFYNTSFDITRSYYYIFNYFDACYKV